MLICHSIENQSHRKYKIHRIWETCNHNNSFNIDLFSDTHTLRIKCEYSRTQCVGGAKEVKIERVFLIIVGLPPFVFDPQLIRNGPKLGRKLFQLSRAQEWIKNTAPDSGVQSGSKRSSYTLDRWSTNPWCKIFQKYLPNI